MKYRIFDVQNLLWLALALAVAGSLKHLANIFASIDGDVTMGWVQAVAIDAGLFALAYSIKVRKVAKRSARPLWFGVAVFGLISIYGNYAYGLQATTGQLPPWITSSMPLVLAASLPILVLFLTELLSEDRQYLQAEAEKAAKREAKKDHRSDQEPANLGTLEQANQVRKQSKTQAMNDLIGYLAANPTASQSEAGQVIGRSKSTVGNYLTELEEAGVISANGNGWKVVE